MGDVLIVHNSSTNDIYNKLINLYGNVLYLDITHDNDYSCNHYGVLNIRFRLFCLFLRTVAEVSIRTRHILVCELESSHSAAEAYRNLCQLFGCE